MHRYHSHAHADAHSIARYIEDIAREQGRSLADVRRIYEAVPTVDMIECERRHEQLLTDFIAKTEGHRPAYLRRIAKEASPDDVLVFLALAMIGAYRAHRLFEARDRHRQCFGPGMGYGAASAEMYAFGCAAKEIVLDYRWPSDVRAGQDQWDVDADDPEPGTGGNG